MKLYYKPGACSLASHIALREVGADFTIEKVDTKIQTTENGEDYTKVNPNGYVPALRLANDDIITEGPAILQYIADTNPDAGLAPLGGTIERARVQQYLSFVGSELHNAFSPLFGANLDDDTRTKAVSNVGRRMSYIESVLSDGRDYLIGSTFTVADAYLFVVANWSNVVKIDLDQWPNVAHFVKRVSGRPATQAAMRAEGLIS